MVARILVRYGAIPEVAWFACDLPEPPARGQRLVVASRRGVELGSALDRDELRREAQAAYSDWHNRIAQWKLDLELIDLEWMLDRQKLVLYVLGGRGPDTTRLALQAAAAGLAVIEVQPVDDSGLVAVPSRGGCGSGACGCHE
jgi:hypothetical protein